jgi:2-polyprenyl-3-methyl-5-hydroxy-6-metoxy-1,4-benzoquinol methylase
MKPPKPEQLADSRMYIAYQNDLAEIFNPDFNSLRRYYYETRHKFVIKLVASYMNKNKRILDVGCAQGNFSLCLAAQGYYVVGIDINPSFLKYAKLKIEPCEKNNVNFLVADGNNLPLREKSFDCVILAEILEHVLSPEKILQESKRTLRKPSSIIIISTPNGARLSKRKVEGYSSFKSKKITNKPAKSFNFHIFEFRRNELINVLQKNGFYFCSLAYVNLLIFSVIPLLLRFRFIKKIEHKLLRLPIIGRKLTINMVCIAKPRS